MNVTRRRWFRFSLRTLFVVLTICSIAGFWCSRYLAFQHARFECERVFAYWEAEAATSKDACEASIRLYRAEAAMPFFNKQLAADAHVKRVERVWFASYGPAGEWLQGIRGDADLARAERTKEEIEAHLDQAYRIAERKNELATPE